MHYRKIMGLSLAYYIELKNYKEAPSDELWVNAMQEELS